MSKKITRRAFAASSAAAAAVAGFGFKPALAQAYPARPVTVIVPWGAGGGTDATARIVAALLEKDLGQPFNVVNRTGGSGVVGHSAIATAQPDGYTIGMLTVEISMMHWQGLTELAPKSYTPLALMNEDPPGIQVSSTSPYKTVAELTAAMKQKGSRASYAVAANPGRIMGAIYRDKAGLEALEVQYRTAADSLNEMQSGKLDYGLLDPIFSLAQQREGRLRVLAISASKRLQSQPDLPTMTESGVPMDLDLWWGVMVPTATPKLIIDKINAWFGEIVRTEETKKFLNGYGADPLINTPERAQQMFETAIKEWAEYVRMAKIEPQ